MTLKRWYKEGMLGRKDGTWEFHTFKKHTRNKFVREVEEMGGTIVNTEEVLLLLIPSFRYRNGYAVVVHLPHTYTKHWR